MSANQRPKISFEQIIDLSQYQSYQEKYICKLCQQLLMNPVACSSCGSIFCKDCILPYVITYNKCPNDCEKFEIVRPSDEMMKMYSNFELICKNCENTFPLTTFCSHYKKCVNDNEKVVCWNCGTEKMNKELKYKTFDEYSLENEYNSKVSFEGDNPFLIFITTKDFTGYVTFEDDYLIVDQDKSKAAIFSEMLIEGKNYIKIFIDDKWKFLGPHYDRGVLIYSWTFCGPIIIDKENQCMVSDDGRTRGSFLTMRISDKRLYFYKETKEYQLCQVALKYL